MTEQEAKMRKDLRTNQVRLYVGSRGILAFTVWQLVSGILRQVISPKLLLDAGGKDGISLIAMIMGYLAALVFLVVVAAVRIMTGIGLSLEAQGKKRTRIGMPGCFLLLLDTAGSIALLLFVPFIKEAEDNLAASLLLEATSLFITVETLFALIRVRYLRKKLSGGNR